MKFSIDGLNGVWFILDVPLIFDLDVPLIFPKLTNFDMKFSIDGLNGVWFILDVPLIFSVNGAYKSRLFDSLGQVYSANKITLASVGANPRYVLSALPSDIPTSASVSFKGIPDNVDIINMVDIQAHSAGTYFKAQFRNVAIAK